MRPIMQPAKLIRRGILAILCGLVVNAAAAEVVVVVSAKNPISAMGADQVANIFLGKTMTYPNGDVVIPVEQSEGAAARQEFHTKVTRKSPALLKAHWSKLLFTGRGQPPRELSDANAIKKTIARNPEFIGYMDRSEIDDSVKVVLVP
jgi:ABC-type phosphate transport system substrate-binding protein